MPFIYGAHGVDCNHLMGFIDRNEDGIVNEQDKYRFHKPMFFTVSIQV
jgi:iron complex outermembrane receptor protein